MTPDSLVPKSLERSARRIDWPSTLFCRIHRLVSASSRPVLPNRRVSIRSARCLSAADIGLYSVIANTPTRATISTGGNRNCHAESPAARATTSSSLRDRLRKANIAPNSTAKGSTCSETAGTRSSDRKATKPAEAPWTSLERRSISTKSIR